MRFGIITLTENYMIEFNCVMLVHSTYSFMIHRKTQFYYKNVNDDVINEFELEGWVGGWGCWVKSEQFLWLNIKKCFHIRR